MKALKIYAATMTLVCATLFATAVGNIYQNAARMREWNKINQDWKTVADDWRKLAERNLRAAEAANATLRRCVESK